METYKLEKAIWDDSDFAGMGWHDATIWSMVANPNDFEFLLDLDYIFKWVYPAEGEKYFKFWISPVTMLFEHVNGVKIDIVSAQGSIEIAGLHREDAEMTPNGKFMQHIYRFECQEGEISIKATGFRLFVRQAPKLGESQSFSLADRNGVGFERCLHAS